MSGTFMFMGDRVLHLIRTQTSLFIATVLFHSQGKLYRTVGEASSTRTLFCVRVPQYSSVSCHSTEVPFPSVSSPENCGLPN
jgi:hypothetical protein